MEPELTEADITEALRASQERNRWQLENPPTDLTELNQLRLRCRETWDAIDSHDKPLKLEAQITLRRAERLTMQAIRKGQKEGWIKAKHHGKGKAWMASQYDFFTPDEMTATSYAISKIATMGDDEFEQAIIVCRANGTASRKALVDLMSTPVTQNRLETFRRLAKNGHSSLQIADAFGYGVDWARRYAQHHHIEIPGDKAMTKRQNVNATNIVETTVASLDALCAGLSMVADTQFDPQLVKEWTTSLGASLGVLNRLHRQLKEQSQ